MHVTPALSPPSSRLKSDRPRYRPVIDGNTALRMLREQSVIQRVIAAIIHPVKSFVMQGTRIGYPVWLGCRDASRGDQAAADLQAEGSYACSLPLDTSDDESVRATAGLFGKTGDRLDVLVNTAGVDVGGTRKIGGLDLAGGRTIIGVDTFGPLHVTQASRRFCEP